MNSASSFPVVVVLAPTTAYDALLDAAAQLQADQASYHGRRLGLGMICS